MLKRGFEIIKRSVGRVDKILFACTLILSLISIVTIFGAVDNFGKSKLIMQIAMSAFGAFMVIVMANIDYEMIVNKLWIVFLAGSVLLLLLTLIFGNSGASRDTSNKSWLEIPFIGISIQPSEFVKVAFICTFAKHLSVVREKINRPLTLLGLGIHALMIVGFILMSGDLGVALVYLAIILFMLLCNGLSLWYFAAAALIVALLSPYIWDKLAIYQQNRIIYGFKPELDPTYYGYQPLLSRKAIAAGGFFGIGLFGKGYYEELPASHTDFIFATICEKFGFVGGLAVIIILIVMTLRIISIALRARKQFGALICVGVAATIIIQSAENIGMCLAMLPVVGITLPFLSAGGSSMLATYMLIGLVHSVNSHNVKYYFERESD